MQPISFNSQCYWIGNQPVYLLSGEFHYFRVPKNDWQKRMRLFKDAGGNCLATYVPWLIHEPQEGKYTFSGEDWLDLEDFLQQAYQEGLYVIARPGPYQYSELVYHGLPGWLVRNYPEILALTPSGEPIGYASVSYTHPLFLEKVRVWFNQVLPILARYTITNGGPVAFVQIDNEAIGIHEWFGSLDYHPTSMGFGQPDGAYSRFLNSRYPSIAALNSAYDTLFPDFAAVKPVPTSQQNIPAQMRHKKDYFDFYLSTIADYAQTLVDMVRSHGIDCPIMHNSGNPGMNAYFLETASRLGSQFLLGSDHYYNLDQNWAQNHPTPQYAARCFVSLEMLRLMGYPPSVLEIPGGSASNWPPVLPDDALTAYFTNLAFGMKGSNYYIFTGGPNPPGTGTTTDLYDYGASISAEGEIRPLYQAQQTFGLFTINRPEWLVARRLSDFRIGLDFEYQRSGHYWSERGPFLVSNGDAAAFLRQGVLTSALCAGLSPEFVNVAKEDWVTDIHTPLVIVSSTSMSAIKQQNIVHFLNNGGKALILPVLPAIDEQFQSCTILSDFLGGAQQSRNPHGISRPHVGSVVNINGTTFPFAALPVGAEVIGQDEFSGDPICLSIAIPGGGQTILLGLQWIHAMREHETMLSQVLKMLGMQPVLETNNPNLWVTAYAHENRYYVFVLNLFTAPMETDLTIHLGSQTTDLGRVKVAPVTVKMIEG